MAVASRPNQLSLESVASTEPGKEGLFDWYRYVQDFAGAFAVEWLQRLGQPDSAVWDPFSGSGTTLVASQLLGMHSCGFDTNPFMVEVAAAKTDWTLDPDRIAAAVATVLDRYTSAVGDDPPSVVKGSWSEHPTLVASSAVVYPDDSKLQKWISPEPLRRFNALRSEIDRIADLRLRRFVRLIAASLIIPMSNMTFRPNVCYEPTPTLDVPLAAIFASRAQQMLDDYTQVIGRSITSASVQKGDSRTDGPASADVVFTSPPYPNDMEYVHQTRLELALMGFTNARRDLTTLKKQMISSSVKLVYKDNGWQKDHGLQVPGVKAVYEPLAVTLEGRNWGWNAADMVAQYFGGMRAVMRNWHDRLRPGGAVAVVVGDSAFNGVKVPTDSLIAETGEAEGFVPEGIEIFRSRWNTKHDIELVESVVLLRRR